MFGILNRYVLREAFTVWVAVTGVLMLILVGNQFARVLGLAASGQVPPDTVLTLLGLTSVQYSTVLVPVGLFFALMLALARFYRDSEMAAVLACGVSPLRLYRPLMVLAFALAVMLSWLALDVAPWAARQTQIIQQTAASTAELRHLEPGRFTQIGDSDIVFYVESIDESGTLHNVFIQHRSATQVALAVAETGEQLEADGTGGQTVILRNGTRYEGIPGEPGFRIVEFGEHGIPVEFPQPELSLDKSELLPTRSLVQSEKLGDRAELQWRLSVPISVFILTMLAVPLSKTDPRQGRYGKLALAALVYLLYSNLLSVARVWVVKGQVPREFGLWWVHALLFGAALFMLWRQGLLRPQALRGERRL